MNDTGSSMNVARSSMNDTGSSMNVTRLALLMARFWSDPCAWPDWIEGDLIWVISNSWEFREYVATGSKQLAMEVIRKHIHSIDWTREAYLTVSLMTWEWVLEQPNQKPFDEYIKAKWWGWELLGWKCVEHVNYCGLCGWVWATNDGEIDCSKCCMRPTCGEEGSIYNNWFHSNGDKKYVKEMIAFLKKELARETAKTAE